jgi:hypothetical protein
MNKSTAIKRMRKLGFKMGVGDCPHFGVQNAEPYYVNGHWSPVNRDVFIAFCNGGFYITSHIYGMFRRFREKGLAYKITVANIFGGGNTLQEAVETFEKNFLTKTYNVSSLSL